MSRTAITIYVAAYDLLQKGYTIEETGEILLTLNQPTEGYVYADEVPKRKRSE